LEETASMLTPEVPGRYRLSGDTGSRQRGFPKAVSPGAAIMGERYVTLYLYNTKKSGQSQEVSQLFAQGF
jgi:hypothetical protein